MGGQTAESTIYNYTLLAKVQSRFWTRLAYLGIPAYMAVFEWLHFGNTSVVGLGFSFVFVQFIHFFIIKICTAIKPEFSLKKWSFLIRSPWIGFLPNKNAQIRDLWNVHVHLLLQGSAVIGLLYPWLSDIHFWNLMLMHAWILLPRFLILFIFKKKMRGGLIQINPKDTSFYIQ